MHALRCGKKQQETLSVLLLLNCSHWKLVQSCIQCSHMSLLFYTFIVSSTGQGARLSRRKNQLFSFSSQKGKLSKGNRFSSMNGAFHKLLIPAGNLFVQNSGYFWIQWKYIFLSFSSCHYCLWEHKVIKAGIT